MTSITSGAESRGVTDDSNEDMQGEFHEQGTSRLQGCSEEDSRQVWHEGSWSHSGVQDAEGERQGQEEESTIEES